MRLSRGLKTVEDVDSNLAKNMHVWSNLTKYEKTQSTATSERTSTEIATTGSVSENSEPDLIMHPSVGLKSIPETDNVRVKRGAEDSYETFYDDINERHRNLEKLDYGRYSKNTETMDNRLQLLNSYEDVDDIRDGLSESNTNVEEEDYPEDEDEDVDYKKVSRSARSKKKKKKKKKRKNKKRHGNSSKQHKRKGHEEKSKYAAGSRRKRRNHKKHSDSKTKAHEYDKKHKKRTSNHDAGVKKSKASQNVRKAHEARHELSTNEGKAGRKRMESENVSDEL